MGSQSQNEVEISLGPANTHGVVLALNPPHKGLVRSAGGLDQRLRGGTYSMDNVVYAVARQLYEYHRPIVSEEVNWRSARAMRARIAPRILMILYAKVAVWWRRRIVDKNIGVSASAWCKYPEQCSRHMPRDAVKFST